MGRYRNCCWTWNNYTEEDVKHVQTEVAKHAHYLVYGKEVGKKGTPHLQGYVEWKKQPTHKTVQKYFKKKAFFEKRYKTQTQAIDYCKKDDDWWEIGTPRWQGERTDITEFKDALLEGKTNDELLDEGYCELVAKYPRFMDIVRRARVPRRTNTTELHILWGNPGTGKSHLAHARTEGKAYYKDQTSKQFWDNYNGTDDIIFEDFRGEIPLAQMLRICDKWPMQIQQKGGFIEFCSRRVFITSNLPPEEWWNKEQRGYEVSMKAFRDRITTIEHFTGPSKRKRKREQKA